MNFFDDPHNTAGMQVDEIEFAVATATSADRHIDPLVSDTLRLVNQKMGMNLAFACEVAGDQPTDPTRELSDVGQWYLFADAFGRSLAAQHWSEPGKPAPQGCFSVPVVLASGRVVGALYAPRFGGDAAEQQQRLRQVEMSAQLLARRIDERGRGAAQPAPAQRSAAVRSMMAAPSAGAPSAARYGTPPLALAA